VTAPALTPDEEAGLVLLDAARVAEVLGCSYSRLCERMRRGEIPHVRIGSRYRLRWPDVLAARASGEFARQRAAAAGRATLFGRMRIEPDDQLGCAIYLMHRAGKLKIGVTDHPAGRARSLSSACGERVEVLCAYLVGDRGEAMRMEASVHRLFDEHRLLGEWFTDGPEIRAWFGLG